jgi:ribosomal protein S15P/S13E
MKIVLLILALVFLTSSPEYSQKQKRFTPQIRSGIKGQVFRTGGPAQRRDWTPPPREGITAIVVLDSLKKHFKEVKTDSHGKFKILLLPGKYYFMVKNSFSPAEAGPVEVLSDSLCTINLFFDNGAR